MARNVCLEPAEEPARQGRFSIREILPPYDPDDPGSWPQGFTVSREHIYDDMARLTGGPEDSSGDNEEPMRIGRRIVRDRLVVATRSQPRSNGRSRSS